ncbi:Aerobic glycerol-3-phosphate dehydrogenase [hydrothermal vent metagenome]|uniref:Aerobic glycerol-3-phosphate dehydrogenase n=1 Tax=hydrothermal vent metagenome TaxID=652676 RepID=A0A3B0YI89_9ZZZZ
MSSPKPLSLTQATAEYDVVIIGGGIQGAGVAQICALNKLKVLLLEQFTVASQTSSRSSKLIHGGLRYLESWQWGLVRECLHERKCLLELAPTLVKLVPFYIPVYTHNSRHPWLIRLGLSLYALLGGLTKDCRFKKVPCAEWPALAGLTVDDLKVVYQYYDAQTDDRLLTEAVIKAAITSGAVVYENTKFLGAQYNGSLTDVEFSTTSEFNNVNHCRARLVVNAAGPWVNQVLNQFTPKIEPQAIETVQGTHLVLQYALDKIYYLEALLDRRAIFAMPWKGNTLLGTTETPYSGDPEKVEPLAAEVAYLKDVFYHYFPKAKGVAVLESFAGLRVLPAMGADVFNATRESRIVCDHSRLTKVISIYGGKLTAYRQNAERVYKLIAQSLNIPKNKFVSSRHSQLAK